MAVNPSGAALQAELARLEAKHGPALRALLKAIHQVVVSMGRAWDNYHLVQSLAQGNGCPSMLPLLADLELAGLVERHKGDIHFPWDGSGEARPDPAVVSLLEGFLAQEPEAVAMQSGERPELPSDLFTGIIGHDDVKELLRAAVLAERPVHVLLVGPPALAKSLFLWDLERALETRAYWFLGSAASRAGILEVVLERRPYVLLADELDKADGRDLGVLLSLMEGGRASRTKVGRMAEEALELRVVAAANDTRRLAPEILSRFAVRHIRPYDHPEFQQVVVGVLLKREGCPPEVAEEIARALTGRTQDVRDAVRISRLVPQLGVKKAVMLLLGQSTNRA